MKENTLWQIQFTKEDWGRDKVEDNFWPAPEISINNVYELSLTSKVIRYLHAVLGFPTKSALLVGRALLNYLSRTISSSQKAIKSCRLHTHDSDLTSFQLPFSSQSYHLQCRCWPLNQFYTNPRNVVVLGDSIRMPLHFQTWVRWSNIEQI